MSRKCSRRGCPDDGAWVPMLIIHPLNVWKPYAPAKLQLGILVCERHKGETKLGDLIGDDQWEQICRLFKAGGKAAPDRERLELRWVAAADVDDALFDRDDGELPDWRSRRPKEDA